jgi:hypothetical protein
MVGIIKVVTDAMAAVPGLGALMEIGKIANDVSKAVRDAAEAGSNATTAASKAVFDVTENVKAALKPANQDSASQLVTHETEAPRGGGNKNMKQALAELARAQRAGKKIENRTRLEIAKFENPKIQTKNNKTGGWNNRATRRRPN